MDRFCVLRFLNGSCTHVKLTVFAMLFFAWCYLPSAVAADRLMGKFLRGEHDMSLRAGGRALQGDNSPPGLWDGDDDDESLYARRRVLISDLRDISPPGLISPPGDDEQFQSTKRALLSDLNDESPSSFTGREEDDEYFHDGRRALLFDLRDVSPPGLWTSGNDDDDEHLVHGRSLLANSENQHQSTPAEDGGDGCKFSPDRAHSRAKALRGATIMQFNVDNAHNLKLTNAGALRDISLTDLGPPQNNPSPCKINAALHEGMTLVDDKRPGADGRAREQQVCETPCDRETLLSMPVVGEKVLFQPLHRKLFAPQNGSSSIGHLAEADAGWFWQRSRQFRVKLLLYFWRLPTISGRMYPSSRVPEGNAREGAFSASISCLHKKLTNGHITGGQVSQCWPQAISFVSPVRMELPPPSQAYRLSLPDILVDERSFVYQ